jgi:hypothetical protein
MKWTKVEMENLERRRCMGIWAVITMQLFMSLVYNFGAMIELRASHILGKFSVTEPHLRA